MSFFHLRIHQINVGRGFAPDPKVGAYSAPPDSLDSFKGDTSWKEGNGGEGKTGRGRKGMGKGEEKGKLRGIVPWLLRNRRPWKSVEDGSVHGLWDTEIKHQILKTNTKTKNSRPRLTIPIFASKILVSFSGLAKKFPVAHEQFPVVHDCYVN